MRALEVIESTRGHVKLWPGALHAPPLGLGDIALVVLHAPPLVLSNVALVARDNRPLRQTQETLLRSGSFLTEGATSVGTSVYEGCWKDTVKRDTPTRDTTTGTSV